jgi:hypothetical protein
MWCSTKDVELHHTSHTGRKDNTSWMTYKSHQKDQWESLVHVLDGWVPREPGKLPYVHTLFWVLADYSNLTEKKNHIWGFTASIVHLCQHNCTLIKNGGMYIPVVFVITECASYCLLITRSTNITLPRNGKGQGYTFLIVRIQHLCVKKEWGTSLLFIIWVILSCTEGWGKDVCLSPVNFQG